ncbi:MAG: hypothetical protein GXO77_02680 [Calditrichaeota bacterium]|nr:hypothetical protein [Calditrichota bacterium]
MAQTKFGSAFILSVFVAVLSVIASAGGLLIDGLYRDNLWARSQWYGNDLVTLFVAVPVLVTAMILGKRGSLRAQLVWFGMLDYALYNYAFYLFGAAFNRFFLIYAALFALSLFALIFALANLNVNETGRKFREKTPVKWISAYMFFWAFGIGGLWIAQSIAFAITGKLPQVIIESNHPTSVVFALDLTLLTPFLVLGAIWLWKRKPWGYVLSVILNVKGAVYALALIAMSVYAAKADIPGASALIPLWSFFAVACLIASWLLLRNLKKSDTPSTLLR